jgi:hypothetical protein
MKLLAKYPLLFSDFNETCISWADFRKKKTQISNFIKIHRVGAKFYANGRTDMTLIVAFLNFANAQKRNKVK